MKKQLETFRENKTQAMIFFDTDEIESIERQFERHKKEYIIAGIILWCASYITWIPLIVKNFHLVVEFFGKLF